MSTPSTIIQTGNTGPVGIYTPAASDAGNSFVQAATTYLPPPATFIGTLRVTPSTANTPSLVYIGTTLYSDYLWSQYNTPGQPLSYFLQSPLSG